jgi:excisionase family DNA binding protein
MNQKFLHSINEAAQLLGIGRSSLYALIAAGEVGTVKIGRRSLIADEELRRFVQFLSSDGLAEARNDG